MYPHFVVLLVLIQACFAKLYTNPADLPTDVYDFIIVGGGTAGNVVANRLTENPHFSVLVLEVGESAEGQLNYTVPLFNRWTWVQSPRDWNYTLVPQPGLNGRVLQFARGRVLGGCSSINGMVYNRGSSDDYDRYARVSGDSGWSWNSIQPYIRKNERWVAPTDGHNTTGQFDPRVHGFHGVNSVSLSGFPPNNPARFQQAINEFGNGVTFNLDPNSGNQLGYGWSQFTIGHGKRSSSATSYLGPQYINRPNLHVLLHAQVTQLLQGAAGPFSTVEFSSNSTIHRVSAIKEVILSAGPLETPHLMMLSGIGDSTELASFGIQTRVHLPDVGKNLSVQHLLSVPYFSNESNPLDDIFRNATLRAQLISEWQETDGGGILGNDYSESLGGPCLRVPANASIFQNISDPSAGPHTCHYSMSTSSGSMNPPPQGYTFSLGGSQWNPTSRGSVTLKSSNPFDNPIIDTNSLATEWDVFVLKESIKMGMKFLAVPAWQSLTLTPQTPEVANLTGDAAIEQYVRNHASPNGHVVATASMSPKSATWGVVDPDLRVKGVKGLRVVDSSVLPYVPAGNTQFVTYMVGERGSDLIKAAWR